MRTLGVYITSLEKDISTAYYQNAAAISLATPSELSMRRRK